MDFLKEYEILKSKKFPISETLQFSVELGKSDDIKLHFQLYCIDQNNPRKMRGHPEDHFQLHGPAGIDYLVCPEAKAIPLTHAMARRLGLDYIVIRKTVKSYMENPIVADVRSITTTAEQHLVMDSSDVVKIYHKKVAVIDDVVSTGGSIHAVESILAKTGCEIAAKAAPLLEEGGHSGEGIIYLEKLPVFPD